MDHGRICAGAKALDLRQREQAIGRSVAFLDAPALARCKYVVRPAQHARRRAAQLDVVATDRDQIVHGVEAGDLQRAHRRHLAFGRDELDHRDRQPALRARFLAHLPLSKVEQRHHGRCLPPLRITREDFSSTRCMLGVPGKRTPALAQFGHVRGKVALSHKAYPAR